MKLPLSFPPPSFPPSLSPFLPPSLTHLVDSDGFPVEFDHVHDFDGVVCVLLPHELHEPVTLVRLSDTIPRNMHIHWKWKIKSILAFVYCNIWCS